MCGEQEYLEQIFIEYAWACDPASTMLFAVCIEYP